MTICSPQLGLSPESNLGGEVHDREMIKALDSLGVKTLIILPWGKKYPPLKHGKLYFLPLPFVYPPWIFNLLVLPYLFFLYSKYHFEVLRVHSPYFVGFAALIFKFFVPEVKNVVTYHHLEKKYRIFDQFLTKKFDLVTAVSEATKKGLGTGIVIPNGVEEKYKPLPKNQKLVQKYGLRNKKILLFLGQLIERKNIPFLFRVLKKLPDNYVLMICGDGPLRQELENKAPGSVIFTGRIPEKDKVGHYNLADVFVYPSLREGFGLSIFEALKSGAIVLANRLPVFEEYGEINNLYLLSLDVGSWVRFIIQLPKKKNISSRIGYGWNNSAKAWLQVIT